MTKQFSLHHFEYGVHIEKLTMLRPWWYQLFLWNKIQTQQSESGLRLKKSGINKVVFTVVEQFLGLFLVLNIIFWKLHLIIYYKWSLPNVNSKYHKLWNVSSSKEVSRSSKAIPCWMNERCVLREWARSSKHNYPQNKFQSIFS